MSIKLMDLEPSRRNAILNAALKEFTLKGYDKASTNIIAKEAGISKALMFHYVNSKQDLFLFMYDYFTGILNKEYFIKIDFTEKDIFVRLRQSYLLQIELLKQYPWILDLNKLSNETNCDEINKELNNRIKQNTCETEILNMIDESKFKEGLDIDKCKQFILWSNIGFTNEILDDIRDSKDSNPDYEHIISTLDGYFDELKKIFYSPSID